MLQAKERAPTPFSFDVFTFGLVVESIKELGSASWVVSCVPRSVPTTIVVTILTTHNIKIP
jgi:hypothetical protein